MSKAKTFSDKLRQLEELVAWFESDEVTVEAALANYQKALELTQELEADLKIAKQEVVIIKQNSKV